MRGAAGAFFSVLVRDSQTHVDCPPVVNERSDARHQLAPDPCTRTDLVPIRSDGLTVTRVSGVSKITNKMFYDNSDVDLILTGLSDGVGRRGSRDSWP